MTGGKLISKWRTQFMCSIGSHEWTCAAREGIKPDPEKIKADPLGYFKEYAKMYCKHCGHVSNRMDGGFKPL